MTKLFDGEIAHTNDGEHVSRIAIYQRYPTATSDNPMPKAMTKAEAIQSSGFLKAYEDQYQLGGLSRYNVNISMPVAKIAGSVIVVEQGINYFC